MVTITVNMTDEKVREALALAAKVLSPESAAKVAVEGAADSVRDNFVTLSRSRHRAGQRINYYLQAADSVIRETEGGTAVVRIPHIGIALRYYGGTVFPSGRTSQVTGKPIRHLAIGLSGTPAEGHDPSDFADLFVVASDDGKAVLGQTSAGGFQALFALVLRAVQPADKTVLPADSAILESAADAILDLYESAMERLP